MKSTQYIILCLIFIAAACKQPKLEIGEGPESKAEETLQWLTYEGDADKPNIVFVSGDEEYRSEEALPLLAKIMNKHHGFNCTVLFAQEPDKPGIVNPNHRFNIPNLESLKGADLMFIFTRFRDLPDDQMQYIDDFLMSGKPVVGVRTSTHAFQFKDEHPDSKWAHYGNFYESDDEWNDGFGRLVLGEKWISHHGWHRHQSTRGVKAAGTDAHPIWSGIENGAIWGPTDVYGVRLPLPDNSQPIVLGQAVNRSGEYDEEDPLYGLRDTDTEVADENPKREASGNPNDPMMPVAWTKSYQLPGGEEGESFASTIGSSTDLLNEGVRRLLVNSVFHLLDLEVPGKANVDIIGEYDPTPYMFVDDQYWTDKQLTVASLK